MSSVRRSNSTCTVQTVHRGFPRDRTTSAWGFPQLPYEQCTGYPQGKSMCAHHFPLSSEAVGCFTPTVLSATEEWSAEERSAEEWNAEEWSAEERSAEEWSTEELNAEEWSAEEWSAEERSAKERPD